MPEEIKILGKGEVIAEDTERALVIFEGYKNSMLCLKRELELIKTKVKLTKEIKKWIKLMETKNTKAIVLEINREKGETFLTFEISPEIETLWKVHEPAIKESTAWDGLKFYYLPGIIESEEYRELLATHRLRDDYGHSIFSDGLFNIAFIRTVGGKGKIKINDSVSHAALSEWINETKEFLKEYFQNYLRDFKISCRLTIDI